MNIIRTVIVKKGQYMKVKDVRRQEEERCMKTKETMYK